MTSFITIVITSPEKISSESSLIVELIESGAVDFVHIRKPDLSLKDMKCLIESIPESIHGHLRLHSHFALLDEYNLAGVHLNSRCPDPPVNARSLTKSCHSLDEIDNAASQFEYLTLSPIFDSISKSGYKAKFNLKELKGKFGTQTVIGLGGIIPSLFPILYQAGFAGAAMLGYVWSQPERKNEIIKEIQKYKNLCCSI